MNEWEPFDRSLADALTDLPPSEETVGAVTPWRLAVDRIVLGLCLTCFTLRFLSLQYLLPALGAVQLYLGFRSLRAENRWFRLGWAAAACKAILLYIDLLLDATPLAGPLSAVFGYLGTGLTFLLFLSLRQGLRQTAASLGRSPRRDPALWACLWYLAMLALALFWPQPGWPVFLLTVYGFYRIVKALVHVTEELEGWGYAVAAAPVRVSTGRLRALFFASLLALAVLSALLSSHRLLAWTPLEQTSEPAEIAALRVQLADQGLPQDLVAALPREELDRLSGSACVPVIPGAGTQQFGESAAVSGALVYLGDATARLYVLAEFDDGLPLFWQNLAEFRGDYGRRDGACYLTCRREDAWYRTAVPVDEFPETVDNYFTGPSQQTAIQARYSFPAGAADRTCLVACTVDLLEGECQTPGGVCYFLQPFVDFSRQHSPLHYPYRPIASGNYGGQSGVQYCPSFTLLPPQS